jgi:hypothetical protein
MPVRSFLINKNLSLYYWLKKRIGKERAYSVASSIEKVILIFGSEQVGGQRMVAYEFYWRDESGNQHFIGILPTIQEVFDHLLYSTVNSSPSFHISIDRDTTGEKKKSDKNNS